MKKKGIICSKLILVVGVVTFKLSLNSAAKMLSGFGRLKERRKKIKKIDMYTQKPWLRLKSIFS